MWIFIKLWEWVKCGYSSSSGDGLNADIYKALEMG